MKQIIKENEYGISVNSNKDILVSSLKVAEVFGKLHKNVYRDIEELIKKLERIHEKSASMRSTDDGSNLSRPNVEDYLNDYKFIKGFYTNLQNKKQPIERVLHATT